MAEYQISIQNPIPKIGRIFEEFDGELTSKQVRHEIMKTDRGGKQPRYKCFFCDEDDQISRIKGKTYVFSNQWGMETRDAANSLAKQFPDLKITINPTT